MLELVGVVLACAAATYLWRGLGVGLARRLDPGSEAFRWVSCVAFAMISGLIARILLMPTGALSAAGLAERLLATGCALAVYFLLTKKNLFVGVTAGALAVVLLRLVAG